MRMMLLGAPGSGKGTQAKFLVEEYEVPQISSGDLLRAAVASGSKLGLQAKTAMEKGELVSDDIVIGLILERLEHDDAQRGYILDGFPRNFSQAEKLEKSLEEVNKPLEAVLLIDVNNQILVERIAGRFTCNSCGTIYNDYFKQPKVEGVCDTCGKSDFVRRADDNIETVRHRLEVYETQTQPLIDFYRDKGILTAVNGEQATEAVYADIRSVLS